MGIGVIVNVNLEPGGAELWTATLKERFRKARFWKGCEQIYLGTDQNDPNHLVIVQKWTSAADHENYAKWALSQPGTAEMHSYLVGNMETTYLDDAAV